MTTISAEKTKMPVLFIGHGNPMYGIEENRFTRGWRSAIEDLPTPKAVVVVSAHWETDGTKVTAMDRPSTIHDFYGFPKELFDVQYPAPGSPELAMRVCESADEVGPDSTWGLDHGTWTILRHLFPDAGIPVIQISLDRRKSSIEHFQFAKTLRWLRDDGVLFIGSGNMVHNLRLANFRATDAHPWAAIADAKLKRLISARETDNLVSYESLGDEVARGIPTPEHYLPFVYALAMSDESDEAEIFNGEIDLASISMTSVKWQSAGR